MHAVDTIIGVGWLAFWVYWLAASARTKATRTRSGIGVRVLVVLVFVVAIQSGAFRRRAAMHNHWLQAIGLVLFALGLALAIWARVYLGRNWGTPMSEKVDPELVTTGPYRFVRHPIYSGIIVATIGTAIAVSASWLVGVVVFGGYFVYSATVEERNMERLFPETYPAYKRSTKMLIPFIF